jgi:hypothetical protein
MHFKFSTEACFIKVKKLNYCIEKSNQNPNPRYNMTKGYNTSEVGAG